VPLPEGGFAVDLTTDVRDLLVLAEREPDRACREFDQLVAAHGRDALARALQRVAGAELEALGLCG